MHNNTIDAETLKKMFLAGAKHLESKKEWINELNVFPVPDGDTGTNMTLTIMSAAKEVSLIEKPNMDTLSKAISSGSLRGARGNSGVILSQIFRGFTKEIKEVEEIDAYTLSNACQRAVESAYKAVMKPKEGTILTVAKAVADKASEMARTDKDLQVILEEMIKHGDYILSKTPEMLPVLKQAGVVDSGGQGFMQILKGAYDAFLGKAIDYKIESTSASFPIQKESTVESDIKFGYCTEFLIKLEKDFADKEEYSFKSYLESIGDSIVVVFDESIVKVHVHTNDPGLAIQKALTYGALSSMKIDNMREEHQEKLIKDAEKIALQEIEEEKKAMQKKEVGFLCVSMGEGLNEIFRGLGADEIIEGGQTMNPSTQDLLNAIEAINAENIFIMPNNGNIILAAEQAKELAEGKKVTVIPSKTIAQGITAMINYVHEKPVLENAKKMTEEMLKVKTGQVTYAVRDTVIDDKEIKENDIMGIADKGIVAVGREIPETSINMVKELVDENSEIISIYYGKDVTEQQAAELTEKIEQLYPNVDVELNMGGQPIYYYIISVE